MLDHQRLQFADEVGVASECKVRLDPLLEDRKSQLFEAGDLALCERLVGDIGKCRSTPESESVAKTLGSLRRAVAHERVSRLSEEPLASRRVELLRCENENVAGRSAQQTRGAERRPQPRDMRPQGRLRRRRRVAVPKIVDQAVARDDLAGVEPQQREKGALVAAAQPG